MGIQSRKSCKFRFIRFSILVTRQVRDSKIALLFTRFLLLTKRWLARRETIEPQELRVRCAKRATWYQCNL